MKTKSHCSLSI